MPTKSPTDAFPRAARAHDFWRVNSYGYPSPFSEGDKALEAWNTFVSFFEFKNYESLKEWWGTDKAPRRIKPHAVESWKATFEEFGLLYVISGSNTITITPAGYQLREAAESDDKVSFAWIGLNLLFRYPLRGARKPKSEAHRTSDLLLYRFWYASLLELDNSLWWTELERVLCRVFHVEEARDAIGDIRDLRASPDLLAKVQLPVEVKAGGFYNSLNQVAVHAGMNHLLLGQESEESPYGVTEAKRRHFVRSEWLGMVRKALMLDAINSSCASAGSVIDQLPKAPEFKDEASYFSYMGAKVPAFTEEKTTALPSIQMTGETVLVMEAGKHYHVDSAKSITGAITTLCQLAKGQRLVMSHDERWTYLVEDKALIDASNVRVSVRQARPISNFEVIRPLLEDNDA